MQSAPLWVACLAVLSSPGSVHTPTSWSPDGRWVAYTIAVRPMDEVLKPGWIWAVDSDAEPISDGRELQSGRPVSGLTYRLWATRVDSGESVLLEESRGPLTSPGWSPDGTSLAFGRSVLEGGGRARFQVVIQDAPDHQRVLQNQPVELDETDAARLHALTILWSPAGRQLAVPTFQPRGLAILRADNGRLLEKLENAYFPAWSPDGGKIAFYIGGEGGGLYVVDSNFGPPRLYLADIGQQTQAPVWSRDGQTVLVVRRRSLKAKADPDADQAELIRVRIDGGPVEKVYPPSDNPGGSEGTLSGVSFAVDHDGEELFYAPTVSGRETIITWYRFRERETRKPFNPFDVTVPMGALAVSPKGKWLALRVGPLDAASPPALCDPDTEKLVPLVPDDATRLEWLATIVSTAKGILRLQFPGPVVEGQTIERATLLPEPGEIASQQQAYFRLRRLARIGRPLCDRPAADSESQTILDEAKLFFDYLGQDYSAALSSLEAVERRTTHPDRRLRLLSLRAQIYLGRGDAERAGATVAYLRSVQSRPPLRYELTAAGPSLSEAAAPARLWPDFLADRAEALKHALAAGKGNDDADVANPDAPQPGLGLDPRDPGDPNPNRDEPVIPFRIERMDIEGLNRGLPRLEGPPPPRLFERPFAPPIAPRPLPPAPGPAPKL